MPGNLAVNEVEGVKAAHCHLSKLQQGGSVPQDITGGSASAAGWPLATPSLGHRWVYVYPASTAAAAPLGMQESREETLLIICLW